MPVNREKYEELINFFGNRIRLVAVSKNKSIDEIRELYNLGQRDFGENYVQELAEKWKALPGDIRWHFIGHLQTNKVKILVPFIHLIQAVDSLKLLKEINKEGQKQNKICNCLLQVHIAEEETKFGFNEHELAEVCQQLDNYPYVKVEGLMGMASLTEDKEKVRAEFRKLKKLYDTIPGASILSMGMSSDFSIAIEEGSNLVRIGTLIFGERLSA
jgi:pyridoxal phosphate enzyme (YggS family)